METFESAFQHIILVEGTKYTDLATDLGGPTRYGITHKTLSAYLGRKATAIDVQSLDMKTARVIYKKFYWDALNLDFMPEGIATAVFDQAVNRGGYKAALDIQTALGVTPDGKIGPVTTATAKIGIEREIILDFCQISLGSYIKIVKANPDQVVNLLGWSRRLFLLIDRFCLP